MAEQQRYSRAVMDLFPWPNGIGFENSEIWWEYVLSQLEEDRLDWLMIAALLSREIGTLLLAHDLMLLERFRFSEQTIAMLGEIQATTLTEFAEKVTTSGR